MSRRHRFREHLPFAPRHEPHFRWRGREVSRLEGLADAIFAFAVTLLVVALEVPRTFDGLQHIVGGLPSFVVCFVLLMMCWNGHYRFFRRYGLEDRLTRFVSLALLLIVLFSVYPLKYLFSAVLDHGPHAAKITSLPQLKFVYRTYGLGFAAIWGLFAVLHWHALRCRHKLQLNAAETIETQGQLWGYLLTLAVCCASIVLSFVTDSPTWPGFIYFALAPLLTWNGWRHGRQIRAMVDRERMPALAA